MARHFRRVVLFGNSVGFVCLPRSRASSRLLQVVSVSRGWCVGCICSGKLCLFALRLVEGEVRMGPSRGFHHYVKGGGHFGVSRLSSFNVGRVGLVGRAVLGACSCSK